MRERRDKWQWWYLNKGNSFFNPNIDPQFIFNNVIVGIISIVAVVGFTIDYFTNQNYSLSNGGVIIINIYVIF